MLGQCLVLTAVMLLPGDEGYRSFVVQTHYNNPGEPTLLARPKHTTAIWKSGSAQLAPEMWPLVSPFVHALT